MERDRANARVDDLSSKIKDTNKAFSSLKSEKDGLASSLKGYRIQITRLATEKAVAIANSNRFENTIAQLQGQNERLSTEVNASKSEINGLNSKIKDATMKFNTLESKHKKCSCELKRVTEEKSEIFVKANSLQDSLAQLEGKTTSLLAAVDESKSNISNSKFDPQCQEIKQLKESNKQELERLRKEMEASSLRNLQEMTEKYGKQNELSVAIFECAKRQQAEEFEKEKDELKTKLADSHNQLVLALKNAKPEETAALYNEIQVIKEQLAQSEQNMGTLRSQLSHLRDQVAVLQSQSAQRSG